ncbi:MAG: amino acid ABC transporter substrate-binding protein [Bacteroidetes bacterium]|nr:amino acid ABC transporter substrate-binding protein [Bacteroidota bacterium]
MRYPLIVLTAVFIISCASVQKPIKNNPNSDLSTSSEKDSFSLLAIGDTILPDSLNAKQKLQLRDTYNIAYALPLFSKDYPEIPAKKKAVSERALRYWWGAQLALDTLKAIGVNANIKVFDTDNDSTKLSKIETQILKDSTDLVFGPLLSQNFEKMAPFATKNKIHFVSALKEIDECNSKSEYTIFPQTNNYVVLKKQVELYDNLLSRKLPVYIFHRKTTNETNEADSLNKILLSFDKNLQIQLNSPETGAIRGKFSSKFQDTCIIFITSSQESFVSSIMAEMVTSRKSFYLAGREDWLEFESLNAEQCEKFNMSFFISFSHDFENNLTRQFVKSYRKTYHEEPNFYAYTGYSQTLYFLTHLYYFGNNFTSYFNTIDYKLPCVQFNMMKDQACGSFENQHLFLYHFKDKEFVEYLPTQNSYKNKSSKDDN